MLDPWWVTYEIAFHLRATIRDQLAALESILRIPVAPRRVSAFEREVDTWDEARIDEELEELEGLLGPEDDAPDDQDAERPPESVPEPTAAEVITGRPAGGTRRRLRRLFPRRPCGELITL